MNFSLLDTACSGRKRYRFFQKHAHLSFIMKVSALYIILMTTSLQLFSNTGKGQDLESIQVTIELNHEDLTSFFKKIESQTRLKFFYFPDQIKEYKDLSLEKGTRSVKATLDKVIGGLPLDYERKENTVVVREVSLKNFNSEQVAISVRGRITDAQTNETLAGVNVIVKGSLNGTTSDANGEYIIDAQPTDVLVFSFIGFKVLEATVGNRTTIDVSMEEDATTLGGIEVNAGYWKVSERENPGDIVRLSGEDISKQPVSNVMGSMIGRMSGVQVTQTTGVPGGGFKINIRGQNSLRSEGNDPLYVVDGVPFTPSSLTSPIGGLIIREGSPLSSISPSDIESVDILKDADATAVYGSRGANGVVLITTKKGNKGKTRFDVNFSRGIANVGHTVDLLNTQQYRQMRKEALMNDGYWPLPVFLQPSFPDLFAWDSTRNTNWQKELIGGTANMTTAQASISGGNENTRFSIGGAYYKEGTVFPGDFGFQRLSGNISIQHTSENKKLEISTTLNYSNSTSDLLNTDLTNMAVMLPPNAPSLYDSVGGINWNWQNALYLNPLSYLRRKYNNDTGNLIANGTFSYEILSGLRLKASAGYTTMQVREFSSSPLSALPPQAAVGQKGSSSFGNGYIKTWIVEPQITYAKNYNGYEFNVLLGTSFQQSLQEGETITATGYTSDALLENIRAATDTHVESATYSKYKYAAIFSRLNITKDEKYILNLTARRDGSSRFGPGNKFGNFGAAGVAWIFSNEDFINESIGILSFGKLRASYGVTGNDAIGNYEYLDTFSPTDYSYNGTSGLYLTRLDNPDYSWEENKKLEVGLDVGFLNDRIFLTTSWYQNRSAKQLVGLPLPVITGQPFVRFNLPASVENRGWEFQLTTLNVRRDNFQWTTNVNVTLPQNRLVSFPDLEAFPVYQSQYEVGKSIFSKRTYKSNGVDPETGLYTFEDVDGDGSPTLNNDAFFLEKISQSCFGGVNNAISYSGFQLDFFFQFVKQTGYNYMQSFNSPGGFSNQPDVVLNRWQESGDVTDIQRYSLVGIGYSAYTSNFQSDNAISDASFIRLKNISLSWMLPSEWLRGLHAGNGRLYIQAQNVFTITNYVGLDPETQNSTTLPPLRTITAGVQVAF